MSNNVVMSPVHLKLVGAICEVMKDALQAELGISEDQFKALSTEMWEVWAQHVQKGRPKIEGRPIPMTNSITLYWHCGLCGQEKPDGVSLREWTSYEGGWTAIGFQMWCKRHEANVMHIDFEGQTHASCNHATREEKAVG